MTDRSTPWRPVLAATAAVLVGIGLARFGYSPLLPAVIQAGWFAPGGAAYLGAANLLGYLAGALLARHAALRFGLRPLLRGAMLTASVSLLACATPLPFAWFFVWRLASGVAGGLLMILGPSSVLPLVPAHRRGLASGVVFTGVGLGIAASGTLVPLLLLMGLQAAWLGLGVLGLVLTAFAWTAWPPTAAPTPVAGATPGRTGAICLVYGLCAVGLVPHMVFLVDYVARGQGRGLAAGSLTWVVFGVGALFGAVLAGRLTDRVGPAPAMRITLALELACVLALLLLRDPALSALAALLAGTLVTGILPAMIGRVHQAAGPDPAARQRSWTQATVAWAIGQASAAYGLTWLYARTGTYAAVLAAAATALVLAGLVEASIAWQAARHPAGWAAVGRPET